MEWKLLKNYEKYYEISESGNIKSIARFHETKNRFGFMLRKCGGKYLKNYSDGRYLYVELNTDRKIKKDLVHRLVYSTFVGELKNGMIIHHKDGNKKNNHYLNLEQIDYHSHNKIHSHSPWNKGIKNPADMVEKARAVREKNYLKKCELVYELKQLGKTNSEISNILNLSISSVVVQNKRYKRYYNL